MILIDSTNGIGNYNNYLQQKAFISQILINSWTISPAQTEANPIAYDGRDPDFTVYGSFSYASLQQLQSAFIRVTSTFGPAQNMLSTGLRLATSAAVDGWRPGVPRVTLLFTSTSDVADVQAAQTYANYLKNDTNILIAIALGLNADPDVLLPLTSGKRFVFRSLSYGSLATNVTLANEINAAICMAPGNAAVGIQQHAAIAFAAGCILLLAAL
uniref:VWFA domain-containing protein n=1 Tax=Plectus sambesii TaxID=2011161 RepID=A0A914XN36_9BILA